MRLFLKICSKLLRNNHLIKHSFIELLLYTMHYFKGSGKFFKDMTESLLLKSQKPPILKTFCLSRIWYKEFLPPKLSKCLKGMAWKLQFHFGRIPLRVLWKKHPREDVWEYREKNQRYHWFDSPFSCTWGLNKMRKAW